jgi:hypothetical protein
MVLFKISWIMSVHFNTPITKICKGLDILGEAHKILHFIVPPRKLSENPVKLQKIPTR